MKDYEALSRAHFDKQAREYDERDTVYYSREGKISCRDIAAMLKKERYESLLDVGCGTGFLLDLLAETGRRRLFGLDLSEEMIKVARGKNIPGATFLQGSADSLPYLDESFDVVTCSQSFHHYPHQERAVAEAYRVLKRGGLYILSDTGVGGLGAWIDNHILFKLARSGDCHTQDRFGIEKLMRMAGFEIADSRQVQGFIYTVAGRKR